MDTHPPDDLGHPWRIADAADGALIATAADRSVAMLHAAMLLAPDGPYPAVSLECDAFAPRTLRAGDLDRHVAEEYACDRYQFVLRLMVERLERTAAEAAQLAGELATAKDALLALSNDMIDDADDLAALNDVARRICDRYGRSAHLAGWYGALTLLRDTAGADAVL